MELRDYQKEAYFNTLNAVKKGKNPLVVMATGTGKTVVFAHLAKKCADLGMKTLVLAHTDELLNQAIDKLYNITGIIAGKEKAASRASVDNRIVVGSVQTMQAGRLQNWPRDNFQLIIIDEAHHTPAKSYKNILEHFKNYSLLGFTATPDRADNKELSAFYDTISFSYSLDQAIKDGYLSRIVGKRVTDLDIDLTKLRIKGKDYSDSELGEVLLRYIIPLSNSIKKETYGEKTLIFMPDVKSSVVISEHLNSIGVSADYLSGERNKDRAKILYDFKIGKFTHLVSCNILLEGFDEPSIESVVMLRPTTSRALYSQAVGRGTRLFDNKDKLKLIEFTYNYSNLRLVQPYDLFASRQFPEQIRDEASRTGDIAIDLLSVLERTKDEWFKPENLSRRLLKKVYGFQQFDPFAVTELFDEELNDDLDIIYNNMRLEGAITPGQIEILNRYNIDWTNLDKAKASKLITTLTDRGYYPSIGPATRKQKWFMTNNGYKYDKHITKAQASIIIDMIKSEKINFKEE